MPAGRKVVLYDFYKGEATLYPSLTKVSQVLKCPSSNVTVVAQERGKYLVLREHYTVFYLDEYNYTHFLVKMKKIKQGSRRRLFKAHDLLTNQTYYFEDTREAGKQLELHHTTISRALKGQLFQAKGYLFEYAHEIQIPDQLPNL